MTDRLTELERELSTIKARYEKAHAALVSCSRELGSLPKISTLNPDDVPGYVAKRDKAQSCGDVYSAIVSDCQARLDILNHQIGELQNQENREARAKANTRRDEIAARIPFLPLTSPERKDLEAELREQ